ncbi:MAG: TonB-dependent receptor [Ignavibacteria bacterium]|jgi:iron complex outermembrane receptor protein|nr:TonB-dependent receptor [Ignavibacteria bacterium]MCU7519107.1 TonB-dependent receptor [Ignavibacteria bacterium]
MMYIRKIALLAIISCLLFQLSYAQPEGSGKRVKSDSTVYYLNQITVSAARYPEEIMRIPYAVTVLGKEQLKTSRGYGLDEILRTVPGVLAQSRYGSQDVRLTIRGFGARGAGDRSNSGTSRGVKILVDGIPETEPDGRTSFDLIDPNIAENVEVIRSNASALWGNASGGVINISTVPDFSSHFITASETFGSYGLNNFILRTGTPLGQGKLYASFSNVNFQGWRRHSQSTRSLVNIGILTKPDESSALGIFIAGASDVFHIPGPLTKAQFDADPQMANPTYEARDERRFNRLGRIGVSFEDDLSESNSISALAYINPKYLQRSERGTFRDFTRYHTGGNFIFRNAFNPANEIENRSSIGMDEAYQDGAILFYSLSAVNGRGSELRDNKREGANSFGAFLQNEITFFGKLSLTLGGRYDNITYFNENYLAQTNNYQKKSFEKFTPKAGLVYRITPLQSFYANLGGGIEVPAGNETDPAGTYGQDTVYLINPLLEPITSTTFEAGTRHTLPLGGFITSVTYDLAFYHIRIKNDIIPYRGGRFFFTAGRTHRTGVEAGTVLNFFRTLVLQGSISYSINKYDEYKVDSVHYNLSKAGKFADYSGNKTAGVPDIFYNAGITWSPAFLMGIYLNVDFMGVGRYFADDANKTEVPAYNTLNASIGFEDLRVIGSLSLKGRVSINNLTDQKYAASAFVNPDVVGGSPVYLEPGLPRNISTSVSIGFN